MSEERTCGWNCGDPTADHKHFAVLVRRDGKLLGRLARNGTTTNRNLFAVIYSKAKASEIAGQINGGHGLVSGLSAKVIPF